MNSQWVKHMIGGGNSQLTEVKEKCNLVPFPLLISQQLKK